MKYNSILNENLRPCRYVYSEYELLGAKLVLSSFWNLSDLVKLFDLKITSHNLTIPVSKGVRPFVGKDVFDSHEFATELFPGEASGTLNHGSSRHACYGPIQLKGVGNNRASIRNDFHHSNGSISLRECLEEYIRGNVLGPFNSTQVSVLGIARFDHGNESFHALIRHFNSFRIPTLLAYELDEIERRNLKFHLLQNYGIKSWQEAKEHVLKQFRKLLRHNLYQSSLALDNFTLMGDLIDFSGIQLDLMTDSPMLLFCQKKEWLGQNRFQSDNVTSHIVFFLRNSLALLNRIFGENESLMPISEILNGIELSPVSRELFERFDAWEIDALAIHSSLHRHGHYQLPSELYEKVSSYSEILFEKEGLVFHYIPIGDFSETLQLKFHRKLKQITELTVSALSDETQHPIIFGQINTMVNSLVKGLGVYHPIKVQQLIDLLRDNFEERSSHLKVPCKVKQGSEFFEFDLLSEGAIVCEGVVSEIIEISIERGSKLMTPVCAWSHLIG